MEFTLSSNGNPLRLEQSVSTTNAYILLFTTFDNGPIAQLRFPSTIPFFQKNPGIYLGDKTPIQVLINGVYKYFEIIEEQKGSNPALVRPVDTLPNKSLNLTVFQRKPNNLYKIGSEITFEGINIVKGIDINAEINIINSLGSSGFIDSVAHCNTTNECSVCSSIACPGSFSCVNGTCQVSNVTDPSMGLRYSEKGGMNILTVKKDTKNEYTFEFISIDDIYPNYRGEQVETWVFAELQPGDTEMQVSLSYPLYILSGTTKIYFTNPKVSGNTTVYVGTTTKDVGIITFKPSKIGNWRQFTFSTNDFPGLKIPGLSGESIALWQNPNMSGKSAVIPKKSKSGAYVWLIIGLVIVLVVIIIIIVVYYVNSKNKNNEVKS